MTEKRVAAFDIGTNTLLCLVAKLDKQGKLTALADLETIVRLGEGVHKNRRFLPEALARAEKCLMEYREKILSMGGVDHFVATATSAARDADNANELLEIGSRLGIPIHIIAGEREAELSFEGALSGISEDLRDNVLVVDVGGGSTELIYSFDGKRRSQSFNVGTVRLTEMFVTKHPVEDFELEKMGQFVDEQFLKFGEVRPKTLVSVAGTPVSLFCMTRGLKYSFEAAHGYDFGRDELRRMLQMLKRMTVEERVAFSGLDSRRADVIVAGAVIMDRVMQLARIDRFLVSGRGLRYGVALQYGEFI